MGTASLEEASSSSVVIFFVVVVSADVVDCGTIALLSDFVSGAFEEEIAEICGAELLPVADAAVADACAALSAALEDDTGVPVAIESAASGAVFKLVSSC